MPVGAGHVQCAIAAAFIDRGEEDVVGWSVESLRGGFDCAFEVG